MNASFKLIDLLPSAVLDWIGGRGGAGDDSGERVGGAGRRGDLAGGRFADRRGAAARRRHCREPGMIHTGKPSNTHGRRCRGGGSDETPSGSIWNYACNQ